MLNWLRRFNIFCFLDSHSYNLPARSFDCLAAAGSRSFVAAAPDGYNAAALDEFTSSRRWAFGHLSFSLQHAFFELPQEAPDPLGFPGYFFFEPETVVRLCDSSLVIESANPDAVYGSLIELPLLPVQPASPVYMTPRLSRPAYLERVASLLRHIGRGDCYEINFCQEFFARPAAFEPFSTYERLSRFSPTPFGGFYRLDDRFLLCASPERFLKKEGARLFAQPIKGTTRRNLADARADEVLREQLRQSAKEQAENVMVVDLMRNDLSQVCRPGTVQVPELFGIYSFPQVHQMVSTVVGELEPGISFSQILAATFPMGSMTGAPKKRVLELIAAHEPSARGLFSGSLGYFHEGDFDFNVVIRSLLYREDPSYLSYQVGSGLTFYCDPEAEWEECRLKALALEKALGNM